MLRRLIVLRHGHAFREDRGGDHERRLDPTGIEECRDIGRGMAAQGWIPDQVVTSDAARTRETWNWVAAQLPLVPPHIHLRELYNCGWIGAIAALSTVDPTRGTVLYVGHNPGCEEIVEIACGRGGWLLGTANAVLLIGAGESWAATLRPGAMRVAGRIAPSLPPQR